MSATLSGERMIESAPSRSRPMIFPIGPDRPGTVTGFSCDSVPSHTRPSSSM